MFEEGNYVESAMHFAKTRCSFEEVLILLPHLLLSLLFFLLLLQVTLRFMALEDASALKNYLKKKLETLRSSEKTQITLIVIWLVEIDLLLLLLLPFLLHLLPLLLFLSTGGDFPEQARKTSGGFRRGGRGVQQLAGSC